ncbi:armadillo-type protein [Crepidotus variabilis]|uniref:Armadillo-type protein n=1 Tax=Crepidotus variabilis TaxID=179855 RepID=A0A9P6EIH6_9AGAR|nr:armadillo-type protein [Crepidotus variabilis]
MNSLSSSSHKPYDVQDGRSEMTQVPLDGAVHDVLASLSLSPSSANVEPFDRQINIYLNGIKDPSSFDTTSEQIILLVNNSEPEHNTGTIHRIASLIYDKAKNNPNQSEVYARLCKKLVKRFSLTVQHEDIKDNNGNPMEGARLFKKFLLEKCQEGFEDLLKAKVDYPESTSNPGPVHEAIAGRKNERRFTYSKLPALGNTNGDDKPAPLVTVTVFICELFKEQLISDSVVHECIKSFLEGIPKKSPDQNRMEALCALFKSAGPSLMSTNRSTKTVSARLQSYLFPMTDAANDSRLPYATKANLNGTIRFLMNLSASQNQFQFTYVPGLSSNNGGNQKPFVQGLVAVTPSEAMTIDGSQPIKKEVTVALDLADKIQQNARDLYQSKALKDDYFTSVPMTERNKVVETFTTQVLEMREADAWLLAALFSHASSEGLCPVDAFVKGFSDIAVWVFSVEHENAPKNFGLVVKGASLNEKQRSEIASKANQRSRMTFRRLRFNQ